MVGYNSHDSPYISVGQQGEEYSPSIEDTLRSLREEIRSWKEENDRLLRLRKYLQGIRISK